MIVALKVPSDPNAKPEDYIDTSSLAAIADQSTDSELHFTVQFKKLIPTGSTVAFQVKKSSNKSTSSGTSTGQTTNLMSLNKTFTYTPSADATFDDPSALLKGGKITGHLTGNNLAGWTAVIKSITDANGKETDVSGKDFKDYATSFTSNSDPASKTVKFGFTLTPGLPSGANVIFTLTKSTNGQTETLESQPYLVK